MIQETGYNFWQWFPLDQLYDLIEPQPFQDYPLHKEMCQQNTQCGSNKRILQLLENIKWLKEHEIY